MYVQAYPSNLFDEQSRGNVDSAARSALFKVSLNQVSHGVFNPGDYKDYYELTPGIGSFQVIVTSDPSNGFSSSASAYAFDLKITDAQGNTLLPADLTGADTFTDSITFTSAGYSTYYLEITNTLFGSFAYGAVLLDLGNHAPVVSVPMVDKNWIEGASLQYSVPSGTFTDPDRNTLSYAASLSGGAALPAWLSFNSTTHTFSGTAPVGSPDYTVRVSVTDAGGLSTFDEVVFFTAAAVNAATYLPHTPAGLIEKALFNFDAFGIANYKFAGTVGISVSDAFTAAQYHANPSLLSSDIYTSLASGNANWTTTQLDNINLVTSTYSNFIHLGFSPVVNESGFTPSAVGAASNINISLIYRTDLRLSGQSALNTDASFGYAQSRGDIVLNLNGFGSSGLANDDTLDGSTFGFHTLMHEMGHSIGLSHPHSSITEELATLTADYAATMNAGFDKLGFPIHSSADMNKEYFSVMSYDDQTPASAPDTFAQTPMILDVIALQAAYGEGGGSSGTGDSTIAPGGSGGVGSYRTYFDVGGNDTIDLVNYASGAYLHMGTSIVSAPHLVGVSMSSADANNMKSAAGDPASLRWFYGEFENASGSAASDDIVGNSLNNIINGLGGGDTISAGAGNDTIDGGTGIDIALFSSGRANYTLTQAGSSYTVKALAATDGTDTLQGVERLRFTDGGIALDLGATQSSGQTVMLLGAVLPGRQVFDVSKQGLLGAAIGLFDQGYSLQTLAGAIMRLPIWDTLTGEPKPTHADMAIYLLTNVNGLAPDATTLADAVAALDSETSFATQGNFLWQLAESATNQTRVDLLGLATTGLAYSA